MNQAVYHSLERTSPKGRPFIGTCRLCGTPNLRVEDALKECRNPRGLTEEESLIDAIEGKPIGKPDRN